MKKNNITDINEYKKNMSDSTLDAALKDVSEANADVEQLSDEMLEAYLDNIDMEIPDLWNRIETGFDAELSNSESKQTRVVKWRRYAGIAAAVLVIAIAIPVVLLNNRSNKSDLNYIMEYEDKGNSDDGYYADMQSAESAAEDASDSFVESEETTNAEFSEDSTEAGFEDFDSVSNKGNSISGVNLADNVELIEIEPANKPSMGFSFALPEGWSYEVEYGDEEALDCTSVYLKPDNSSLEGRIVIRYVKSFGVCGTGLEEKQIDFNGYDAYQGFYDGNDTWSFIVLQGEYENCVILNEAEWYQDYSEEADKILSTVQFKYYE